MPMDFSTVHLVSTYQQFFSLSFFRLVRVLVSTMDPLSFNKAPQMGWTIWHELASFSNHDLKHFMLPRIDPCATHKLIFLYSPTAFSLSFLPCGPFPNMHAPSLFFTFHLIPSFSSGRLSLCLLLFNHPHNPSSLPIIKSLIDKSHPLIDQTRTQEPQNPKSSNVTERNINKKALKQWNPNPNQWTEIKRTRTKTPL